MLNFFEFRKVEFKQKKTFIEQNYANYEFEKSKKDKVKAFANLKYYTQYQGQKCKVKANVLLPKTWVEFEIFNNKTSKTLGRT